MVLGGAAERCILPAECRLSFKLDFPDPSHLVPRASRIRHRSERRVRRCAKFRLSGSAAFTLVAHPSGYFFVLHCSSAIIALAMATAKAPEDFFRCGGHCRFSLCPCICKGFHPADFLATERCTGSVSAGTKVSAIRKNTGVAAFHPADNRRPFHLVFRQDDLFCSENAHEDARLVTEHLHCPTEHHDQGRDSDEYALGFLHGLLMALPCITYCVVSW